MPDEGHWMSAYESQKPAYEVKAVAPNVFPVAN